MSLDEYWKDFKHKEGDSICEGVEGNTNSGGNWFSLRRFFSRWTKPVPK